MQKNKYYCRIDGKIYNLKKIQDIIDENPNKPNYGKIFLASIEEYGLPKDNFLDQLIKFNNNEIPADYNECLERMRARNSARHSNVPKCPTCGSTNIEKISVTKKVTGGFLFGLFSSDVRNTMHCKKCGYKW